MGKNVYLNRWRIATAFLDQVERGFSEFLDSVKEGDIKSEYLLPNSIGDLIQERKAKVAVLETKNKWFGVTYKEDKEMVVESFQRLIADGVYREELYSDLG